MCRCARYHIPVYIEYLLKMTSNLLKVKYTDNLIMSPLDGIPLSISKQWQGQSFSFAASSSVLENVFSIWGNDSTSLFCGWLGPCSVLSYFSFYPICVYFCIHFMAERLQVFFCCWINRKSHFSALLLCCSFFLGDLSQINSQSYPLPAIDLANNGFGSFNVRCQRSVVRVHKFKLVILHHPSRKVIH